MYIPIRFFGLISEKQIIFKINIESKKFIFDSVKMCDKNEINLKHLFNNVNKNIFSEIFALKSNGINYLTCKKDCWYSVKVNDIEFLKEQLLIFDISEISQKYSNKVSNVDYTELIVDDAYDCIVHGNISQLGKRMLTYWKITRDIYPYSTNIKIDKIYSDAILNGAYGCSIDDNFMVVLSDKINNDKIINKLKNNNIFPIEWSF